MGRRTLLRDQLGAAWREAITGQYQAQLINSERGLQVYFCAALLKSFDNSGVRRRIFVEPCLSLDKGEKYVYPDIVICSPRSIIGVVELKYLPRGRPDVAKDKRTLEYVAANPGVLNIANERFLGIVADRQNYPLSSDAVLCWGGVYTGKRLNLRAKMRKAARDRFFQLDALTSANKDAIVEVG
jgi:hypothetical protein